ncbi:phosphatidylserine decarboxylase [Pseudopedobacter saltans DSM 12145]|uniref:Phosphatidylserine decarboxylase n=1 Tax=Pseudopedobacter saltans (strain ATCC 51119 / DSM 12145 / JCM 21818 / CCUG 39354 / LMG 10337 / NBRC 100064 / NCIMB 13643) TaxID=762903 RepID=F0S8B2_PSESL|nr:phosphatidylserine decarboxylase [Pseudopedobacter saltans]ADY53376.1 phosphatidylserine decarboxylase [Pseudopedobacter saltans DSM 12145]
MKSKSNPQLYNRSTGNVEVEDAYKSGGLKILYRTVLGRAVTKSVLIKRRISRLYGNYMNSPKSTKKINEFIRHYNIDVSEIKRPLDSFKSFNDFFIRELKEDARPIDDTPEHLVSPADSRLFVFDLAGKPQLPIKGYWYQVEDLVKDKAIADQYKDGWCFIYRLAPNDYHRYAYLDSGYQENVIKINGILHSVNPIALKETPSVMAKNYRELTILYTDNFGPVAHIEVGALFVGKIVNREYGKYKFKRGEEKGWFEFGGSTVIQLFRKDAIAPDADILEQTQKGIETIVRLGEKTGIARK